MIRLSPSPVPAGCVGERFYDDDELEEIGRDAGLDDVHVMGHLIVLVELIHAG